MRLENSDKVASTYPWASARLAARILLPVVLLMPGLASAQDGGAVAKASKTSALASANPASTPDNPGHTGRMSRQFSAAALHALSTLREMRTDLAYTINNGYPLEKLWLASDRERSADALDLAALAASTDADSAALDELLQYFDGLQHWSDDLLADNREMRMAQHYMTPGALQNDEEYQALVATEGALNVRLGSVRAPAPGDVPDDSERANAQ